MLARAWRAFWARLPRMRRPPKQTATSCSRTCGGVKKAVTQVMESIRFCRASERGIASGSCDPAHRRCLTSKRGTRALCAHVTQPLTGGLRSWHARDEVSIASHVCCSPPKELSGGPDNSPMLKGVPLRKGIQFSGVPCEVFWRVHLS